MKRAFPDKFLSVSLSHLPDRIDSGRRSVPARKSCPVEYDSLSASQKQDHPCLLFRRRPLPELHGGRCGRRWNTRPPRPSPWWLLTSKKRGWLFCLSIALCPQASFLSTQTLCSFGRCSCHLLDQSEYRWRGGLYLRRNSPLLDKHRPRKCIRMHTCGASFRGHWEYFMVMLRIKGMRIFTPAGYRTTCKNRASRERKHYYSLLTPVSPSVRPFRRYRGPRLVDARP